MPTRRCSLLGAALTTWLFTSVAAMAAEPVGLELRKGIHPEDGPSFYVHAGVGNIILSERAAMHAFGHRMADATIQVDPQITAVLEIGYFLTPNIAISLTGGIPPEIDIRGDGAIGSLGTLGTAVYGPATLTAHYHFRDFGRIQPYFGGGLAVMKVFDTEDDVLSKLEIDDTFGPAVQAGVDIMLGEH